MKSESFTKNSESNQRTVLYSDETKDNNNENGSVQFKFYDNTTASYALTQVININPFFFSTIAIQNQVEIPLPEFITRELLMEFMFIVQNGFNELEESLNDITNKIISLIKVSDFFQNESISVQLISDIAIERVNIENAFEYLHFSYDKMNKINEANNEFDTVYFDLFYKCLETIGKKPSFFIKNIPQIQTLERKVIDELIQKLFSNLITGKYILSEGANSDMGLNDEMEDDNYFNTIGKGGNGKKEQNETNFISIEELTSLINFLKQLNSINDFFELLSREYMSLFSNETINELKDIPNPTFEVKIPYDFDNYYEEYPINLTVNEKNVMFVVFYKKSDDSFNVSIKLGDSIYNNTKGNNNRHYAKDEKYCFKIFTFLSIVKINNDNVNSNSNNNNNNSQGIIQTNLKSLSNNKSMHPIFKMSNFKNFFKSKLKSIAYKHEGIFSPKHHDIQIINDGLIASVKEDLDNSISICSDEFFSVTIYLKICYVHSVLSSYLLNNFSLLSHENNIHKISKQLLILIIKNKYINKSNEDDIIIGILNWLNDEINIKENITEVFDVIIWSKISEEILFEFIFKYSHMINDDIENMLIKEYQSKFPPQNQNIAVGMIKNLIKTAKKINYNTIFTTMKKNEKYNMIYLKLPKSENEKVINSKESVELNKNNNNNKTIKNKRKNLKVNVNTDIDEKYQNYSNKKTSESTAKTSAKAQSQTLKFLLSHTLNPKGIMESNNIGSPIKKENKNKQSSKPKKIKHIITKRNFEGINAYRNNCKRFINSNSNNNNNKNSNNNLITFSPNKTKLNCNLELKRKKNVSCLQKEIIDIITQSKKNKNFFHRNQSFSLNIPSPMQFYDYHSNNNKSKL